MSDLEFMTSYVDHLSLALLVSIFSLIASGIFKSRTDLIWLLSTTLLLILFSSLLVTNMEYIAENLSTDFYVMFIAYIALVIIFIRNLYVYFRNRKRTKYNTNKEV
ncbi:NADH:ubiquinone oxidoreductase subunit K [Chryseomicrobium aureum]|uniref:hypothetical protein n=1 Tax=Chryseomicrobium aureum TaxID=1441723 RepID=UPI0019597D94|nr:hypothetical protein [Chryseomicrobium aureum]MBM7706352.1 NADH:ubiquinone oxidoreductase subunit K [Chryseomicrobium aureum]